VDDCAKLFRRARSISSVSIESGYIDPIIYLCGG
jgi:hypothetical protein